VRLKATDISFRIVIGPEGFDETHRRDRSIPDHMTEFTKKISGQSQHLGFPTDNELAIAVHGQQSLLLLRPNRNKSRGRSSNGFADCFGMNGVCLSKFFQPLRTRCRRSVPVRPTTASDNGKSAQRAGLLKSEKNLRVANSVCGWLLHCKSFLAISAVIFVSTVVCPACLCGGVPLALMNSASEVPIGLSAAGGHCHSRSVLALG
jgi:hypothetical protein